MISKVNGPPTASFIFAVAILYSANDFQAILNSNGQFPLAEFYAQATGSKGGTFGLLLAMTPAMIFGELATVLTVYLIRSTVSRTRSQFVEGWPDLMDFSEG